MNTKKNVVLAVIGTEASAGVFRGQVRLSEEKAFRSTRHCR
jgi:hypothetical protein